MPLQGENDLTRLTRGEADALPRANRFWAFSPMAKRNKTMSLPPENVIANTAITSSCKNSGMHTIVVRAAGQQRIAVELNGIGYVLTAYIPSDLMEKTEDDLIENG